MTGLGYTPAVTLAVCLDVRLLLQVGWVLWVLPGGTLDAVPGEATGVMQGGAQLRSKLRVSASQGGVLCECCCDAAGVGGAVQLHHCPPMFPRPPADVLSSAVGRP